MGNIKDLSLAYSPGVAEPCLEIANNPELSYKYTNRGNTVAVVSDGSSVLGLGNIGPLAAKPCLEGKAVFYNKFAGIEAVDIGIDTQNPETFIKCVKALEPTFGGINLEDIRVPEGYDYETTLKDAMDIPVIHADLCGSSIVVLAGLINGLHYVNKSIKDVTIVLVAGKSARAATINLLRKYGFDPDRIILCDATGVVYKGREENMNERKEKYALDTDKRTLEDAMKGADVAIGFSGEGGLFTAPLIKSMNEKPIIFALSNPQPEVTPDDVYSIRDDAIIATGRADYPNQLNSLMCFPFLFRGTLDVKASDINEEMKLACALSIANLARKKVPDSVKLAHFGVDIEFGREYILPSLFDHRLLTTVPIDVAISAITSGVARNFITDWTSYKY